MSRQADARHGQAQPPRQQQIHQAQIDGIARAPVHHAVQVTVLRVVIILLVPLEPQHVKNVFVERRQKLVRVRAQIHPLQQFSRVTVEQRLVRLHVDVRVLRLRQQPRALFQVQVIALGQAKRQEPVVRRLPLPCAG